MKAILFVILNVSVCFPRRSVGVEILIPGEVWGVERKKFSRLAIARHDPPPLQHTFNFYASHRETDRQTERTINLLRQLGEGNGPY